MSLHRQNPKRDAIERDVIAALEQIGIIVLPISGAGCPDLLSYDPRKRSWLPIEVKSVKGKLTALQTNVRRTAMFPIVRTVDEALALFGVIDRGAGYVVDRGAD